MPEPRIWLIDQDGVLADFDPMIRQRLIEQFPDMPLRPYEEHEHFQFSDNYSSVWDPVIKNICVAPGFIRSLLPIPGAIEAVKTLVAMGETVRICTSPLSQYEHCVLEKYEWVEKYLGREFTANIILTRDKTLVNGTYLIDDKPKIDGVMKPTWEHIVFTQPYNRNVVDRRRINWQNWRQVLGI